MTKKQQTLISRLVEMADAAVAASEGRLRLAYREKDRTSELEAHAGRFLKLDNVRVSGDFEYLSMLVLVDNLEVAVRKFHEETLLPVRTAGLEKSFQIMDDFLTSITPNPAIQAPVHEVVD